MDRAVRLLLLNKLYQIVLSQGDAWKLKLDFITLGVNKLN